ncbi:MAG: PorT family protein [Bacteroidales bacterium]|nr:PorT family protein [Bacteroidales bacterium]
MKKLLAILALTFGIVSAANAQIGVIGGFTSSKTSVNTQDVMSNINNVSLFHAGVAYRIELGSFFAVQPQLAFQMKGATMQEMMGTGDAKAALSTLNTKAGFIELSAGLQAGIDLLAVRPYFLFEPFVGVQVTGLDNYSNVATAISEDAKAEMNKYLADAKNKLEVGFGVGGGIQILDHFQVSVQWFMNLGSLYNNGKIDADAIKSAALSNYKDIKNYQGIKVTLGLFF